MSDQIYTGDGLRHDATIDPTPSELAAPTGSANIAQLEEERLMLNARIGWLQAQLDAAQKEMSAMCRKLDALRNPPNDQAEP